MLEPIGLIRAPDREPGAPFPSPSAVPQREETPVDKQKRLPVPAERGPGRPAPGLARRRWVALAAGTPRDSPSAAAGPPLPFFGGETPFFNSSPSCSAPRGSVVTQRGQRRRRKKRGRKAHAPQAEGLAAGRSGGSSLAPPPVGTSTIPGCGYTHQHRPMYFFFQAKIF